MSITLLATYVEGCVHFPHRFPQNHLQDFLIHGVPPFSSGTLIHTQTPSHNSLHDLFETFRTGVSQNQPNSLN